MEAKLGVLLLSLTNGTDLLDESEKESLLLLGGRDCIFGQSGLDGCYGLFHSQATNGVNID
jgi:hypothetical protein